MDIWVVLENVDHGADKYMSTHLTRKGAYVEAWTCLLGTFEGLEGEDMEPADWISEEHSKDLCDFLDKMLEVWRGEGCNPAVPSQSPDWSGIKLDDLEKHFDDFQLAVHEPLDWAKEVSIHKTKVQAQEKENGYLVSNRQI